MNAPTEPPEPIEPLAPDAVDELLSAELDHEFDAAARDLGLSVADAHARLAATPGTDARRRALTDARAALATPVAPLASEQREELLAHARGGRAGIDELARRRRRPATSRIAGVLVAAAAILLVVGLAVSIATTGSDSGDDASTAGGSSGDAVTNTAGAEAAPDATAEGLASAPPAAAVHMYDFGVVTDEVALQARVADALARADQQSALERDADDEGATSTESADACLATQAATFAVGPVPTVRGPVEYQGTAAEVLVFPRGEDSLVLTVASADCRLLVSLFVHP